MKMPGKRRAKLRVRNMGSLLLPGVFARVAFGAVLPPAFDPKTWLRAYVGFVPCLLVTQVMIHILGWESVLTGGELLAIEGFLMAMMVVGMARSSLPFAHQRTLGLVIAMWSASVVLFNTDFEISGISMDLPLGITAAVRLFLLVPCVVWPPSRRDSGFS